MVSEIRVVSYGGGVQSTALLVLAAAGHIDYRTFLFCNVGEDSENPETLTYVSEIALPYAARHGLDLIELRRTRRDGSANTVLREVNEAQNWIPIPLRTHVGIAHRSCTSNFKTRPVARWLKHQGATPEQPATVALGISTDEFQRAKTESGIPWETLDYPLLRLRFSRELCKRVIRDAGLPEPPRSACWFCPMRSARGWAEMKLTQPERFQRCVELERSITGRRAVHNNISAFFHSKLKPLDVATADGYQPTLDLDEDGGCESGYCWT